MVTKNGSFVYRMYKQGHTVCGAELAEQAVKEFFDENSIPVEVEEVKSIGNVYKVWENFEAVYTKYEVYYTLFNR